MNNRVERRSDPYIRQQMKPWNCPRCGFEQPSGSKAYLMDNNEYVCGTCAIFEVKNNGV